MLRIKEKIPLRFAAPDSLGLAVMMALQNVAAPMRVVRCLGQGRDVRVQCYGAPLWPMARELFVEHVLAGTVIGARESVNLAMRELTSVIGMRSGAQWARYAMPCGAGS